MAPGQNLSLMAGAHAQTTVPSAPSHLTPGSRSVAHSFPSSKTEPEQTPPADVSPPCSLLKLLQETLCGRSLTPRWAYGADAGRGGSYYFGFCCLLSQGAGTETLSTKEGDERAQGQPWRAENIWTALAPLRFWQRGFSRGERGGRLSDKKSSELLEQG